MARDAADAARSARPKGDNFSVSLRMFHGEVLVTNGAGWKSRTREFNPSVSFIKILILKSFHEMFGLGDFGKAVRPANPWQGRQVVAQPRRFRERPGGHHDVHEIL